MKKIVISCGPIPARLDSVKYITNRFKGGLAFKTAEYLILRGYDTTIVAWEKTEIPETVRQYLTGDAHVSIVYVKDVFDYYGWFEKNAKSYDAFIMAAAVANLTPTNPYEGKFPSHLYRPGDKFSIEFQIAPRAIDVIKQKNPRCCLVGYKLFDTPDKDELAEIAKHTLADSKANIIFANTPSMAKTEKLAVTADNSVIPVSFDEHMEMIHRAISHATYFKTVLSEAPETLPDVRIAKNIVRMYEETFPGYGTIAVPVEGSKTGFVTTARGHKGDPVYVYNVDMEAHTVFADGKATLNAPTLAAALEGNRQSIVVHRHMDDPHYGYGCGLPDCELEEYTFPGTAEEVEAVRAVLPGRPASRWRLKFAHHGDLSIIPIRGVDWEKYYEEFPKKYFGTSKTLAGIMKEYGRGETLEVGCNRMCACKYAFDPFVGDIAGEGGREVTRLGYEDIWDRHFDFVLVRNAVNYLEPDIIRALVSNCDAFAANTFFQAPDEKVTKKDCATRHGNRVYHSLRLADDTLVQHSFYAYGPEDYEAMGLTVTRYGENSCLVTKGIRPDLLGKTPLPEGWEPAGGTDEGRIKR